MGSHRNLSLTGQWQFWCSFLRMSLTGQLQFLLPFGMGYHKKLSLTGQWQFSGSPGPIGSCLKQRIIPLYGHTTYGHMSLTTVNDKSLWTKLKKVSLTLVNDKKIVIDHGQWQKKLSLTERYLYRDSVNYGGSKIPISSFYHCNQHSPFMSRKSGWTILQIAIHSM